MKLEGTVEHVIYENADSGYAVFEVDAGGTDVVVAGNVGGVDNGMSVTVYGHMVNHPSYGEQFRAETIEARLPEDRTAILSYLSSGVLPYIGPSTAKKIVAKFGDDTLTVIAETPQRLCELKGITEQKAAIISNEFRRMYGVREVVAWFARYGMTAQQAVTCYRALGPHTVEALTQNPYLLCGEPLQLKFGQVDTIAAALQFETGCRLRVAAGLLYALRHNAGNGHTCLPRDKLLESTSKFLRLPLGDLEAALDELLSSEELRTRTFDGVEYIYLPDLLSAEEDSAARLGQLSTFPTEAPPTLDADIRVLEMAQGFAYAPLQRQAIRLALSSRVMVLTGGPGTGKTTTVNAILSLYEALYDRVALCAPTGRAAKRLSELTNHAASTIHRLLEVDYSSGSVRFIHNEKNLLKYDVSGAAGCGAVPLPHHYGGRRRPAAQRRAGQHSGRDFKGGRRADGTSYRYFPPGAAQPDCPERPPHCGGADAAEGRAEGRFLPDRVQRPCLPEAGLRPCQHAAAESLRL